MLYYNYWNPCYNIPSGDLKLIERIDFEKWVNYRLGIRFRGSGTTVGKIKNEDTLTYKQNIFTLSHRKQDTDRIKTTVL